MSDTSVAADPARRPPAEQDRNPLRDVVDRMDRAREHIGKVDPQLSDTIKALAERADRPGIMENPVYRGRVAYALLDLEKLAGPVSNMPEPLRQEMTQLGTSVRGLQNERLQDLMRKTSEIPDSGLVRDIRIVATDTAGRSSQDTSAIRERVEVLENKARLSSGAPAVAAKDPSLVQPVVSGPAVPEVQERDQARGPTSANPLSSPMPAEHRTPQVANPGQTTQPAGQVRVPGLAASILSALHRPEQQRSASLDPTPTPMAERVNRFEQNLREGKEERAFRGAEQSGRAAVEAMQAFASGPGAGVMSRIRDAAKSDPSGMAGVMSEMRPGGIYAELRTQFDGAMVKEKGFAAAYDKAAAAAGQYGKDRSAVDAIMAQRPDVDALTSRFQKLDAQIGEAASSTPGRKEGKSALEELAEKAVEVIAKALDRVRSAFSNSPRSSNSPSPSP